MIKDRNAKAEMHGMTFCPFYHILVVSLSAPKWFSPPVLLGAGAYIHTGGLPNNVIGRNGGKVGQIGRGCDGKQRMKNDFF